MEMFEKILLLFYRKITKNHPYRLSLNRSLTTLIHQIQVNQMAQSGNSKKQLEANYSRAIDITTNSDKTQNSESYKKLQNIAKEWDFSIIFQSMKQLRTILYVVFASMIASENIIMFKLLEQKVEQQLAHVHWQQNILHKSSQSWVKIAQLFVFKHKLRWEKSLAEIVNSLPPPFEELFLNILTEQTHSKKQREILTNLSQILKIRLVYFQINGQRMPALAKYGAGQKEFYLGYISDVERYVMTNKMPQQPIQYRQKEASIDNLSQKLTELLKLYSQNTSKINNLEVFKHLKISQHRTISNDKLL